VQIIIACITSKEDSDPMAQTLYTQARPHLSNTEIEKKAKALWSQLPKKSTSWLYGTKKDW
jgi:hypothetical protein